MLLLRWPCHGSRKNSNSIWPACAHYHCEGVCTTFTDHRHGAGPAPAGWRSRCLVAHHTAVVEVGRATRVQTQARRMVQVPTAEGEGEGGEARLQPCIYMLIRDAGRRKKEANKQQGKATKHTQGSQFPNDCTCSCMHFWFIEFIM